MDCDAPPSFQRKTVFMAKVWGMQPGVEDMSNDELQSPFMITCSYKNITKYR